MVLWHSLWRWAKYRHPNKTSAWIIKRYWYRLGGRRWCFAVAAGSNPHPAHPMTAWLVDPTKTPIRRHVKVKSNANPFDPDWCGYFESRERLKKARARR